MAITRVNQGEIVEVPFELPDGSILPHPALVLSNEYLQDYEDGLFYAVLTGDEALAFREKAEETLKKRGSIDFSKQRAVMKAILAKAKF